MAVAEGGDWSEVFRRSTVHPAVFAVRDPAVATDLLTWAIGHPLVHRHQAYAFSAELDGWALLDGGLSYLRSRAHGRLRSGLRIIGWSALRHLVDRLGLTPPRRLLVGESTRRDDDELRRLVDEGWVLVPPPPRQAGLLVSYVDARGLADVARLLVGAAAGTALPPGPRCRPLVAQTPHLVDVAAHGVIDQKNSSYVMPFSPRTSAIIRIEASSASDGTE